MKKYYTESGWKQHQRYYEEGPSPEWLALYRDANALLKADPASDEAQAVADRWFDLSVRAYRGDHHLKTHSPAALADRDNWPVAMKQRMSEFNLEEVTDFVQMAALHARRKYFSESSWTRFRCSFARWRLRPTPLSPSALPGARWLFMLGHALPTRAECRILFFANVFSVQIWRA
jgi:hypothetical protein